MLNGKAFGAAIGEAIERKLASGAVPTKTAIAKHFGIKPPSLSDWVKKGSVSKEKLYEMWLYFSDVAGPEHWGMSTHEWPSGIPLKPRQDSKTKGLVQTVPRSLLSQKPGKQILEKNNESVVLTEDQKLILRAFDLCSGDARDEWLDIARLKIARLEGVKANAA